MISPVGPCGPISKYAWGGSYGELMIGLLRPLAATVSDAVMSVIPLDTEFSADTWIALGQA